MHKKIATELEALANSILEQKNSADIESLQAKAKELYEKLTILKFVEQNLESNFVEEKVETVVEETKIEPIEEEIVESIPDDIKEEVLEEITSEVKEAVENEVEEVVIEETSKEIELKPEISTSITEEKLVEDVFDKPIEEVEPKVATEFVEDKLEEKVEEVFNNEVELVKNDAEDIPKIHSLEDEFENAISADVATSMFERATKEEPIIEKTVEKAEEEIREKKVSLNDSLFKDNIQIGLNDRIAFTKHLFDGSQEDFNRVISQLNSFGTEKEAKSFLNKFVKPDYNWTNKEEYEQRLVKLIERKFL